ncbi:MAG: acyltransferase [Candidatus Cloacimonetes bacterium]|nr:acyltransferase [Candidatus Cloacimonadota bacterium]
MKKKIKVGSMLKVKITKRAFRNLICFSAWFAPWKGLRKFFHKLRGTKIGKKVEIGYYVFIDNRYPEMIEIQDRATVTSNCTILAHDLSMRYIDNTETVGEVVIGKGAFIGMNTIILPGVVIGENCIIGCGSVVTKDTEPNSIYVGVPAKLIKRLSPQKQ